jgi:hypothetical protein
VDRTTYHDSPLAGIDSENLRVLRSFCLTRVVPENRADTLVKELLKHHLLDIAAVVYRKGSGESIKERALLFVDKLVRLLISVQNRCSERHGCHGHATMGETQLSTLRPGI